MSLGKGQLAKDAAPFYRLRAPTANRQEEHKIQCSVIEWAGYARGRWPELGRLFAIPNGGFRDIVSARKLKDEGVRAGVPDLCLPAARGGYFGLWIEMKRPGGVMRDTQSDWRDYLNGAGYLSVKCDSMDLAIQTLTDYLSSPRTKVQHEDIGSTGVESMGVAGGPPKGDGSASPSCPDDNRNGPTPEPPARRSRGKKKISLVFEVSDL